MPYTYILFSEKVNKYYVGACIDLKRVLAMARYSLNVRLVAASQCSLKTKMKKLLFSGENVNPELMMIRH